MALTQPARVEPCALGLRGRAVGSALLLTVFFNIYLFHNTKRRLF
jgi:hypothetical protein